ncbi:MAG: hypothetical protein ACRDQF_04010 [Thermocrispum sp.]
MFKVYCPQHGSDVLLGLRRIKRVVNVEPGVIEVELICYDGQVLTLVTGSRATEAGRRPEVHPAA